jgi:hypothetical protein
MAIFEATAARVTQEDLPGAYRPLVVEPDGRPWVRVGRTSVIFPGNGPVYDASASLS